MGKRKDFLAMVREKKEKGEIPDYESKLRETASKLESQHSDQQEDEGGQKKGQESGQSIGQENGQENIELKTQYSEITDNNSNQLTDRKKDNKTDGEKDKQTDGQQKGQEEGQQNGQENTEQTTQPTENTDTIYTTKSDSKPGRKTDRESDRKISGQENGQESGQELGQENEQHNGQLGKKTDRKKGGQENGQKKRQESGQEKGQESGQENQFRYLTKNQKQVLLYIIDNSPLEMPMEEMVSYTGVSYGTLRKILKFLESNQYVLVDYVGKGQKRRKRYISLVDLDGQESGQESGQEKGHQNGQENERTTNRTRKRAGSPLDREREEEIYLSRKDLKIYYPNLINIGWTVKQSRQIIEKFEMMGWDRSELDECFRTAEILAGDSEFLQTINKGPLNFLYGSISNNTIHFPEGYKSPQERAAEKRKQKLQQIEDEEFRNWKASLTQEEYDEIMKNKKGPEEIFLKHYWKTNIKN